MAEDQYDHEPCCDCKGAGCLDCYGTGHTHAPLEDPGPLLLALQDSINRAYGVTPDHQGAPITLHPGAVWTLPPHEDRPSTPVEGASSSEVPHSGKQTTTPVEARACCHGPDCHGSGPDCYPEEPDMSEPTPTQRRDAWLALVQHLERELLTTRENAKAGAKLVMEEPGARRYPAQYAKTAMEWEVTAWAAQRLLDSITALTAPEVPRDDETGQESILDVLQGMQDPDFLAKRKAADDGRVIHWRGETGAMLHGLHNLSSPARTSGDEDEVTCLRCLTALAER